MLCFLWTYLVKYLTNQYWRQYVFSLCYHLTRNDGKRCTGPTTCYWMKRMIQKSFDTTCPSSTFTYLNHLFETYDLNRDINQWKCNFFSACLLDEIIKASNIQKDYTRPVFFVIKRIDKFSYQCERRRHNEL